MILYGLTQHYKIVLLSPGPTIFKIQIKKTEDILGNLYGISGSCMDKIFSDWLAQS